MLPGNARIMVLAATNRPWDLDEAILRRFSRAFEVGLPNASERATIMRVILNGENVADDIDYTKIALLTEGFSGSDLKELCRQAAYIPIRELLEQEKNGQETSKVPRPLKHSDIESSFIASKSSNLATEYGGRRQIQEPSAQGSLMLRWSELVNVLALLGGDSNRILEQ
ncbi:hypothetical protein AMTR_s00011p00253270 [Amborella trichopoda]|uniref:AAA ATPase AAA+ lid domain-containing protein n=1 Tax=Amborella trichopoda TaxID=13333 RepID=W1NGX8_AMBTC|nr:hypothetical protein AMTR_s00011p00253270 [Amborella trichopoda]